MDELPWMKPDFDLGKVIASDSSGNYRAALERALGDLCRRLHAQRSIARTPAALDQLDRLLDACDAASAVLDAAHDALQAV
jgi:hypothetical protein